ncbi:uncharacterized protein LOC123201491 isoform X2 [Mangifera indica]|uniref:uncharacterized protein LOC123201491 isoform X2 n=1 Tax=Mangifera indica TaxID=29780 RepID=UPI001CF9CB91|nr:uncharacterized protein LOC123201491 isoform X2 [Mangifera indica]
MGDLRDWSLELNGAVLEERPLSSPSLVPLNQTEIGAEYWQKAEEATRAIIAKVQPTVVSEARRKAVIDYVQRLIRNRLSCEVFPFGSVPLKTYLPDGDIDLTIFGGPNVEALASDVCSVLDREGQNRAAEFVVKDTQLIRAEVDRLIGKDHLFKRSIILIKAWCYYESRILGAHHGLISTYALETLVLYIFRLFHSSLNGPLAVLYKFLDYFSKFDWDNYCISLSGPVRVSSLPDVVVETPENGGQDLLLSTDLKVCLKQFSAPSRGFETNSRTFSPKHLNIVDPLKENNNLGRSVSKGNFYRIRSAFTYGARKLGRILSQPEESLADELHKFFFNTLDRHGSGQRPDVQDLVPLTRFGATSTFSGTESCEDQTIYESESSNSSGITDNGRLDHKAQLCGGLINIKMCETEPSECRTMNESHGSVDRTAVSEVRLCGDAKDLATSRIQDLKITNGASRSSSPIIEENTSLVGKAHHAPYLYFTSSPTENGEVGNGNIEWKQPANFGCAEKHSTAGVLHAPCKENSLIVPRYQDDGAMHDVLSPAGSKYYPIMSTVGCSSEDFNYGYSGYQASSMTSGTPKALSDLSGNYNSHLISLHHGWLWHEHTLNASYSSVPPQLLSQIQNKNSWDVMQQSLPVTRNSIPHANGIVPRPLFYPMNRLILLGQNFGMEEMSKPRGTGTYFPNMSHYRNRSLTSRGRIQAPIRSHRSTGRATMHHETNFPEGSSQELATEHLNAHQGGGKNELLDICRSSSPEKRPQPNSNGSSHPTEGTVEFGSVEVVHLSVRATPLESSRQPNSSLSHSSPTDKNSKPLIDNDQDRSNLLKDEDFPPLSTYGSQ